MFFGIDTFIFTIVIVSICLLAVSNWKKRKEIEILVTKNEKFHMMICGIAGVRNGVDNKLFNAEAGIRKISEMLRRAGL